jgi:radical SAM protein with 4Fe4S-binding SPASM domain
MINVSRLYCGTENPSDEFRYRSDNDEGPACPPKPWRRPVIVYNCTDKCNQNCLHCYSKNDFSSGKELDTFQAKELLKQLIRIKCPVVLFSGGEPLEREDIFELLDFSCKAGLRTVLSTNGYFITSDMARHLVDVGVSYVGISIDGKEETHDKFRGASGSFAAAINAVKFCKNAGLKVGLRFTITNLNYYQVRDIFALAAKLNVKRICFYHLISAGQAARSNLKCTNEQIRQALNDILDCAQSYAAKGITEVLTVGNHADGPFILNRLKQENSPLYEKSLSLLQKFGGNKIGTKLFAIDPQGNVHPDQFWQNFSLGNITETSLKDIFKNSFDIFKDKTLFAPQKCKKCRWLKICGTNARFLGNDFGQPNWILEPKCFLDDAEIRITGALNAEFTCQNAKA